MNRKKRLYDLIVDADNEFYRETPTGTASERIEKIADYLLANGVIVPILDENKIVYCFYDISKHGDRRCNCMIRSCARLSSCSAVLIRAKKFRRSYQNLIGKTVFLTREEAEAALKERQTKEEE